MFYIGLLSVAVVFALIMATDGGDIVIGGTSNHTAEETWMQRAKEFALHSAVSTPESFWNNRFWCHDEHPGGWIICCADVCGGVYSVYRFSFTVAVFFCLMILLTCFKSKFAARAHRGFWFAKLALILGLLISTLFIENSFLESYRELARYLSFLFLLLQILLVIDFAYTWNDTWISYSENNEDEGLCGWRLAIVASAASMYIVSIVSWVLFYIYFGKPECPGQQAVISVTLILCVILTVVSCSKIAPHGTLLTSAAVTAYSTYLCYSALASHPDGKCNPYAGRTGESFGSLLVGIAVAAISMASTAYNAAGSKEALVGKDPSASDLDKPLDDAAKSSDPEEEEEVQPESWWYFHAMMVACAFYMSMLLTDWSSQPASVGMPAVPGQFSVGLPSFWVKLSSQWICLLMYAWTLLAPYLLRDTRDFGVEFDF